MLCLSHHKHNPSPHIYQTLDDEFLMISTTSLLLYSFQKLNLNVEENLLELHPCHLLIRFKKDIMTELSSVVMVYLYCMRRWKGLMLYILHQKHNPSPHTYQTLDNEFLMTPTTPLSLVFLSNLNLNVEKNLLEIQQKTL